MNSVNGPDYLAEGSRLGKMAIEADANADYKQAYALYEECLRAYIEGLKSEDQDDRVKWAHEQIVIRYERLHELHGWYKRKSLLEPNWLDISDLRDRLEGVAPLVGSKLRLVSAVPANNAMQHANNMGGQPMVPSQSAMSQDTITSAGTPINRLSQTTTMQQPPPPPPNQEQQVVQEFTSARRRDSFSSLRAPTVPLTQDQQVNGGVGQPMSQMQNQQGGYGQPSVPNGYRQTSFGGQPLPLSNAATPIIGQALTAPVPIAPGNPNMPQPQMYNTNGIQQQPQLQQNQYVPQQPQQYVYDAPGDQLPRGMNGMNSNMPPLQHANTNISQYQPQPQGMPMQTSHLFTPYIRNNNQPSKMYHCYNALQRYHNGAEGWNIQVKDGTKNPIYYLYGLKQANTALTEMSLHREDGKKTRCMDLYAPPRNQAQYIPGDMTYKHYLPVPVEIQSRGEIYPGIKRRIFTYNNRRFVWKADPASPQNEGLYEVDDGPQGYRPSNPNQGVLGDGVILDYKLAWYEHVFARKKLGRVGVVGGLDLQTEEVFLGTCLGTLCLGWEVSKKDKI